MHKISSEDSLLFWNALRPHMLQQLHTIEILTGNYDDLFLYIVTLLL